MSKIYCVLLSALLFSACAEQKNNSLPHTKMAEMAQMANTRERSFQGELVAESSEAHKKTAQNNQDIKENKASQLSPAEMAAYAELEIFAKNFVRKSNQNIMPSKAKPKVEASSGVVIVSYVEIDPYSIELEILPVQNEHFQYIAKMRYLERHFVGRGTDVRSAMSGKLELVATQRITELPRYVASKWVE